MSNISAAAKDATSAGVARKLSSTNDSIFASCKIEDITVTIRSHFNADKRLDDIIYSIVSSKLRDFSGEKV